MIHFTITRLLTWIRNRVLVEPQTPSTILGLNAVLAEAPDPLTDDFSDETANIIAAAIKDSVRRPVLWRKFNTTNPYRIQWWRTMQFSQLANIS